eukprot:scaffold70982_cov62-Attheya_sp.AAC.2
MPCGNSVLSYISVHMAKITQFMEVFADPEIFNIDQERGVVCLHLEYANIVGQAWTTTPQGKCPGFFLAMKSFATEEVSRSCTLVC